MEIDKSKLTPFRSEGTAFFIDSVGTLITNRHVIAPWHYDKSLSNYFYSKVLPFVKKLFKENEWGYVEQDIKGELESITIYTNGNRYLKENRIVCKQHKISEDEDIDLASIKTADGKTPRTATIISFKQIQKREKEIKINSPAYVIGYPMGIISQ
ncbi:MAG: trypsin-like peptidase domain-containing protein [Bacteroidetes bacterium]|nr:trypsin-like peptidase domain-containing protein [Bacteroidota bacterium]